MVGGVFEFHQQQTVAPPHLPPAGEHHRLVQTTQEHGSADDLQRKARPREAEERPVQPSHHLPAANAQQCNTSGLNPQDGVRRLHLTQQVAILFLYLTTQNHHAVMRIISTDPQSVNELPIPLVTYLETSEWKLRCTFSQSVCPFS